MGSQGAPRGPPHPARGQSWVQRGLGGSWLLPTPWESSVCAPQRKPEPLTPPHPPDTSLRMGLPALSLHRSSSMSNRHGDKAGILPSGRGVTLMTRRLGLGRGRAQTALPSLGTKGRRNEISYLWRIFRNPTCKKEWKWGNSGGGGQIVPGGQGPPEIPGEGGEGTECFVNNWEKHHKNIYFGCTKRATKITR